MTSSGVVPRANSLPVWVCNTSNGLWIEQQSIFFLAPVCAEAFMLEEVNDNRYSLLLVLPSHFYVLLALLLHYYYYTTCASAYP